MRAANALAVIAFSLFAVPAIWAQSHPIVFIDGNGAEQEAARSTPSVKRHDQTIELAKDLLKSCPEISLTRNEHVVPDYFLLLNRGEENALFGSAESQVMLMDSAKNVLYAEGEGTVARAAKDGCKAILADWKNRRAHTSHEPAPEWNVTKP
jgi:hypothetical protein